MGIESKQVYFSLKNTLISKAQNRFLPMCSNFAYPAEARGAVWKNCVAVLLNSIRFHTFWHSETALHLYLWCSNSWILHSKLPFDSAKFGGPAWMSGRHLGVSVRGRDCSDYRLDRMKDAAIADPGPVPAIYSIFHIAMHSRSSATCSSQKIW
jgi:hypothetical protein